jgi:nucleotide-binding universal stress UspA family protein
MTEETYVVAYEGDERHHVLDYAISQAGKAGAKLHILHVLEWSPYSFLTPEELEERHARRRSEMERAQEIIVAPAIERAKKADVAAEGEIRYGSVVEVVTQTAKNIGASMIFVGRSGGNTLGARIFGSVPLGLAQSAQVPTVIVP